MDVVAETELQEAKPEPAEVRADDPPVDERTSDPSAGAPLDPTSTETDSASLPQSSVANGDETALASSVGKEDATIPANSAPKIEQKQFISEEKDGLNKIFVGGITQETSDADLRAYFGAHGAILDITIMKDRLTGKSRGFGFITFESTAVVDKVVASKHEINGKMVEAKPAVPRGLQSNFGGRSSTAPHAEDSSQKATKIFVGGLSPNVNDAELKEYFSQFGSIVEATVVVDKETSRKRGFGFITFVSFQSVDDILSKKEHCILDKVVEVKKAFPKGSASQAMNRSAPPMSYRGGGGGGGGGGYPTRGYGGNGQGYYQGHEGGYGQAAAYPYYGGGYEHANAGYQGYSSQGYGGTGHSAGYSEQPAAYGHDDASMHAMYGGQGMQQGYAGYDAQQAAYSGAYGGSYSGAYQGYADPSGVYGAQTNQRYDAAAAGRYHPYSR